MSVVERPSGPPDEQPTTNGPELFRAVNERIRELEGGWLVDEYDFICECEDASCMRVLRMTAEQYEALRADPACFAVLPGHEHPDIDEIVSSVEGLVIVRKRGGREQRAHRHPDPAGTRR